MKFVITQKQQAEIIASVWDKPSSRYALSAVYYLGGITGGAVCGSILAVIVGGIVGAIFSDQFLGEIFMGSILLCVLLYCNYLRLTLSKARGSDSKDEES